MSGESPPRGKIDFKKACLKPLVMFKPEKKTGNGHSVAVSAGGEHFLSASILSLHRYRFIGQLCHS